MDDTLKGSDADGPSISRRTALGGAAAIVGGLAVSPGMAAQVSGRTESAADELAWLPAWRLREMFKSRKLSPLEYAEHLISRTESLAHIGAFITVFPEHLLAQAKAATGLRGDDLPLLHGLPVSVKDTIQTKGQRTTGGSLLFKDFVPDVDSIASEQIKKNGGIIFAKSNTPEFANGARALNHLSRESVNPWDTARTAGGSSGGAGAATAAGLGPLAVGTDGGGSIRIPAAFNGVFGLCPSEGRVPNGASIYAGPSSRVGPITRDVRDAALLLQAMAVVDARDPFTMKTSAPDYLAELEKGIAGVRVAWSPDFGRILPHEPECVSVCHEAAKAFRSMGANYSEPSVRLEDTLDPFEPSPEYSAEQIYRHVLEVDPDFQDSFTQLKSLSPEEYRKLTVYVRDRIERMSFSDYAMRIPPKVRYRTKDRLSDLFRKIDLLLSPTIARRAFVCGDENVTPWQYVGYTHIVNASGYCAASVPAGFHEGMPVGLQIMGRPGDELLVLRAARAFEKARPWAQKRPSLDAQA